MEQALGPIAFGVVAKDGLCITRDEYYRDGSMESIRAAPAYSVHLRRPTMTSSVVLMPDTVVLPHSFSA
jgi:hypothetical protein